MGFLVFTYVGIAAALGQILRPGRHQLGAAASFAVGVLGSWGGALLASTFIRGGWASFGLESLAGSVCGALAGIVAMELAARTYVESELR
ncbi:MAG TPA: hypothetical protein VMG32_10730 [Anaeromyxobacteraceae bacterium]|nr:hypothetical protein [Anaeromyxobacteraceae bacterium]